MRTVQMTLDEHLIASVDKAARALKTTRSAFTRSALREALARLETRRLEEKHRQGYASCPAGADEFTAWENEHAWGDE